MNETTNVTPVTETPATETAPVQKVNKSQLIVAAFKANAKGLDTPANDLVDQIKSESGVDVTVNLVNNLRCRLRKESKRRKAKRTARPAPKPAVAVDPLDRLFAVKDFAAKVGGLNELKALVEKLERLAA